MNKILLPLFLLLSFLSSVHAEEGFIEEEFKDYPAYPPSGYSYHYTRISGMDTTEWFIFHEGNSEYTFYTYINREVLLAHMPRLKIIDKNTVRIMGLTVLESCYQENPPESNLRVDLDIVKTDSIIIPKYSKDWNKRPKSFFILADRFRVYNDNMENVYRLQRSIRHNHCLDVFIGTFFRVRMFKETANTPEESWTIQGPCPFQFLNELLDQTVPERIYHHRMPYGAVFNTKSKNLVIED